ncbi:MAG: alpha/beta fold hydrolase [Pseudomonadota bacterium]
MTEKPHKDLVILLHGILRSKTDMLMLDKFLEKNGYDTLNILYPSREMSLEDLTNFVAEKIGDNKNRKLHFVTHSMGGLIARYFIATHKPKNLGRVVMLSPPNTGSEFADFLHDNEILGPAFRKIFGPAGSQLKTDYQHIDGDITYPLGIIAGSSSINPLAPWVLKDGDHDGIVPVERTKIEGMTDHIVIPTTHTFMMFNPKVMEQTLYFLKYEKFV